MLAHPVDEFARTMDGLGLVDEGSASGEGIGKIRLLTNKYGLAKGSVHVVLGETRNHGHWQVCPLFRRRQT